LAAAQLLMVEKVAVAQPILYSVVREWNYERAFDLCWKATEYFSVGVNEGREFLN
jgi:hypothetical protein